MSRNKVVIALSLFIVFSFFLKGYAQSLGDPVVHITFGSGTAVRGGALSADSGSTTYTYTDTEIGENYYTLTNLCNTAVHAQFVTSTDHTGNPGGYMMVVNGNLTAGTVFTRTVPGLCGTTSYQFGVWVKNVLASGGILPNMVFHIYAADGVTELGTGVSTGDVPTGNVWRNYTANFTLPAGTGSVVIKLESKASGQQGNDFAVDDITFSPYGSTVSVAYDQTTATTQTTCAGTSQTYTIKATSTLNSGYVQKLQAYINGAWVDQGTASTATTFQVTSPTIAGTYLYRLVSAMTDNISSANCVVASNQLTLNVLAAPDAAFTSSAPTCFGDATTFTATGAGNSTWLWDFGDGSPAATTQNPSHTYTTAGDKSVKLTVTNSNTCTATQTNIIHISALPTGAFTAVQADCKVNDVVFTDNSTPGEGTIKTWDWNFGDGNSVTRLNNSPLTVKYAAAGDYTVTLKVTNANGCTNTKTQHVIVRPIPVVDFTLPDVCQNDVSTFTNKSTMADSTPLTYQWDFGDKNATAANNMSTAANASHQYSKADVYTVKLTATSQYGCSVTKSMTFTVNGDTPSPKFTATNSSGNPVLCSADDVVFNTTGSSVNFGSITKLVWYFDFANHPNDAVTFTKDQLHADNIYKHNYGGFTSPVVQSYQVRMVAYSGESCSTILDKNITVNASPVIGVSGPNVICQGAAPVQLTVQNINAASGKGVFSGPGVSADGLFSPAVAGPGKVDIIYLFTATSGCTYTDTLLIEVDPSPKVNAGTDVYVLEGGQQQLNATATGIEPLKYKWTLANGNSATGLDKDNVLNPHVTATVNITYMLTVTSGEGCSASANVNVIVVKNLVVPNTFTPNGDGINDTWDIQYLSGYPGSSVSIFNRYGYKVYKSVGYSKPWDGIYKGEQLPAGTYYYVIDPNNGSKIVSGSITIIR